MKESVAYVQDGKVHQKQQVSIISYYLKGKAFDFYIQKVSRTEHKWTLAEFFKEMFDYFFPPDFKMWI